MEIAVLGEYSPFGHADPSHTTATRNNATFPRYELYPPTLDGILHDILETKHETSQASSKRAPCGYDVEIFVQGAKVTWTQGGVLRKILDFSSENEVVQQTLFAWFIVNIPSQNSYRERDRDREGGEDDDIGQLYTAENPGADHQGKQQALVIILKETARIYFPSGESYYIHLPFGVHKVWAMDLGLLMERKTEPGEEMSEAREGEGLPRFYMVMDPFNEVQIVTLYRLPKQPLSSKTTAEKDMPQIRHLNGVVGDIFNTCVFLSNLDANDKTVVTFDLLWNRHRVWRYASSMPSALPFSRMQSQANLGSMEIDTDVDADLQMRTDTYLFEIESNIQSAS